MSVDYIVFFFKYEISLPSFLTCNFDKDGFFIFVIKLDPAYIIDLVLKAFLQSSLCHCNFYHPSTFAHFAHL